MTAKGGADDRYAYVHGKRVGMPESKTTSAKLRDDLRLIFARAKVPTNPAIALEILRLADDPDSSAEQFADVIQADVALSARLLEMANAAMWWRLAFSSWPTSTVWGRPASI
jgi:hypothetical protein